MLSIQLKICSEEVDRARLHYRRSDSVPGVGEGQGERVRLRRERSHFPVTNFRRALPMPPLEPCQITPSFCLRQLIYAFGAPPTPVATRRACTTFSPTMPPRAIQLVRSPLYLVPEDPTLVERVIGQSDEAWTTLERLRRRNEREDVHLTNRRAIVEG